MKPYFDRLFRYRGWANQRTMDSVLNCPAAQAEATPLIAHLLAAEQVWLSRLQRQQPALAVWPKLTLDECKILAGQLDTGWADYIGRLTEEALLTEIDYRNSRGDAWRNSVVDILTHVATHGGYHRGQIARVVGRAGGAAAVTDFIVYLRSPNAASG
jgi:uncharacterized damage-inducible protein DinB